MTATFSHVSVLHLLFNMTSMWQYRFIEHSVRHGVRCAGVTSPQLGFIGYMRLSVVFMVVSVAAIIGVYYMLHKRTQEERYLHTVGLGYSWCSLERPLVCADPRSVVFGWMSWVALQQPSGSINLLVVSLPFSVAPFSALLVTQLMIPQASFVVRRWLGVPRG